MSLYKVAEMEAYGGPCPPAPLPVCCYLIHFREKETDVPECYPLSSEFHHAEFLRWNLGVGKRDGEHIAASIRVILQMTCVRPVMPAVQCQTSFSFTLEEKKKTFFFYPVIRIEFFQTVAHCHTITTFHFRFLLFNFVKNSNVFFCPRQWATLLSLFASQVILFQIFLQLWRRMDSFLT